MSRQYYVRDRGRIIGPFSNEQLFEMRDRGQLQAYHEVSIDQRTWKAFDLMFPPTQAGKGTGSQDPAPNPNKGMRRPPPGSNRTTMIVASSVGGLVVVAGIVVAVILFMRKDDGAKNNSETIPEGAITFHQGGQTRARDNAVSDSVGLVVPGFRIQFTDDWAEERLGHGSGFAISPNGHILTNRHVVEKIVNLKQSENALSAKIGGRAEAKIWVFFGRDNRHEADIDSVYVSTNYDLAILKIKKPTPHFFALSQTDESRIPMLESVSSLGYPSTDQDAQRILNPDAPKIPLKGAPVERGFLDADFGVTKELGSIKKRSFSAKPDTKYLLANYLVHTARIAPGNSGGPLLAKDGTVMGINTLVISFTLGKEKIVQEGQNFALTLPQLRKEIDAHVPGVVWRDAPD